MNIFNALLTFILVYGYPAIAVAVLLTSMGIPLPGIAIVLVAGSLAAAGYHNIGILFLLVTVCSVAGDLVDYYLGKKVGYLLIQKLTKRSALAERSFIRTQHYFTKWSGVCIFLTRWLVPPLGPTTSILSGVTSYPLRKFLLFDISGEIVSSIIFLGLGYAFSINWPYLWSYLSSATGIVTGMIVGLIFLVVGLRKISHIHHSEK